MTWTQILMLLCFIGVVMVIVITLIPEKPFVKRGDVLHRNGQWRDG